MRVSLAAQPPPSRNSARPLLKGPQIVLGDHSANTVLPDAIQARADTLFGPRGLCLVAANGPLWICDTGHHRLLGWRGLPAEDNTKADWIIGQRDFYHEGRNAKKSPADATSLNVPTGITAYADGLAVADAWNHRVLIWRELPENHNTPADLVLGQADFNSTEPNRGRNQADADTLYWPYGVFAAGERLFVADSQNRRVLIWNGCPQYHGQPADLVLGQPDFKQSAENAGGTATAMSMRWPHAITLWQERLCVADAGNNRIMIWPWIPDTNGSKCSVILGQADSHRVDHNQSQYWPRADTLNMPYGISAIDDWLIVADTANSRLLGWYYDDLTPNAAATALTGQPDFQAKGDNRWQLAERDSLCWPYAVQTCSGSLFICVADSGNNRVQLWQPAV